MNIEEYLEEVEGVNLKRYMVDGIPHIGTGHNLGIHQSAEELAIIGSPDIQEITPEQNKQLLAQDITDAEEDIRLIFSDEEILSWSEVRYAVIISQCFQLGLGGLRKFKNMIAAIKADDWEKAARESMDSLAARQTPRRWQRQAAMMRNDTWDGTQTAKNPTTDVPDHQPNLSARLDVIEGKVDKLWTFFVENFAK